MALSLEMGTSPEYRRVLSLPQPGSSCTLCASAVSECQLPPAGKRRPKGSQGSRRAGLGGSSAAAAVAAKHSARQAQAAVKGMMMENPEKGEMTQSVESGRQRFI